jgi:hypothetical protein
MRFLAGGQPLDLGWPYGIADSTVYMVIDETLASMDVMLDNIKFPQTEYDCIHEAAAFQKLRSSPFRGIIAAMDGIAVAITCPRLSCCPDPRKYYNRKGFFAISVQACVSASYKVTFVSAMHAGSTHDSTAFLSTSLHGHLLKKEEDGGLPSWARVAADNAYGNGVAGGRVLTPYAGRLMKRQDSFNYYLSSLRILVEQVFGVVVGRFGVLWSPMRCTIVKAARIVVVCCRLNNFIIEERVRREGANIDHGAGAPVGSDPDNHVLGAPDVFSQDDLHCEPEVARHVRQGDGAVRESMADFLELSGLVRPSRRR